MAELYRRRVLAIGGQIEDNPLTSGATTLTSAGLAALPALGTDEYFPVILDPDGDSGAPEIAYITAHTAGANTATISRGKESTTARAFDRDSWWCHGPTVKDYDGRDGSTGLLAYKQYAPGSDTSISTTTSSTFADVDATNLILPAIVIPANGALLFEFSGLQAVTGSASDYIWNVRTGSTDVVGSEAYVNNAVGFSSHVTAKVVVTGLTPGASVQYKWGHRRMAGSGTCGVYGGPNYGKAFFAAYGVNV